MRWMLYFSTIVLFSKKKDIFYRKVETKVRYRINRKYILTFFLYLFLIIWFMDLTCFSVIPSISTIFNVGKIISSISILVICFRKKKMRISKMFHFILLYSIVLVLSSIINGAAVMTAIISVATIICFYLILSEMMRSHPIVCVDVLQLLFEIMIYVNLLLMLLFPRGIYNISNSTRHYWLFGHQNANSFFCYGGIIVGVLYYEIKKKKGIINRAFFLILASLVSIVITHSANGYMGLAAVCLIIVLNRYNIKPTIFHGFVISCTIFILIVLLRKQELFSYIITVVLHRDLTFSSRLSIWDQALYYFSQKPLLGYGLESVASSRAKFGGVATPHNTFLNLLYQGGIVLFLTWIGMILSPIKSIKKWMGSKTVIVINAIIISILIQAQVESVYTVITFFPLFLADNIDVVFGNTNFKLCAKCPIRSHSVGGKCISCRFGLQHLYKKG